MAFKRSRVGSFQSPSLHHPCLPLRGQFPSAPPFHLEVRLTSDPVLNGLSEKLPDRDTVSAYQEGSGRRELSAEGGHAGEGSCSSGAGLDLNRRQSAAFADDEIDFTAVFSPVEEFAPSGR